MSPWIFEQDGAEEMEKGGGNVEEHNQTLYEMMLLEGLFGWEGV